MNRKSLWFQGALAMGVALAVIYAAGRLLGPVSYPPARIADFIVRLTPGDFATRMIESLGHLALRGLAISVHVGAIVFGGFVAVITNAAAGERSQARRSLIAALAGAVVAIGLALGSTEGLGLLPLATYVGAALAFAKLGSNSKLSTAFDPEIQGEETPLDAIRRSRRKFIVRTGGVVAAVAVGGWATFRFLAGFMQVDIEIAEADIAFEPPPGDPGFPAVPGLSPEITANEDFYTIDINFLKPRIDHRDWRLKVGGLVEQPFELTYAELQSDFEVVEMAHTLTCISNEVGGDLISTAVWRGVRLSEVLERGRLSDGVIDIVFRAAEGYSDSIRLEKALEDTTLVVFGMNGSPLPVAHGFPARIIVPGIYGMKNVKWLTEIEPVATDYQGYWMVRGWSDVARVKTQSRIDTPGNQDALTPLAKIAGVAWAGDRRVASVEISQDGGRTWGPALMKRELSPLTWRLWATDLEPGSGPRTIVVRATDGEGDLQESNSTRPHPEGASGRHTLEVVIQ